MLKAQRSPRVQRRLHVPPPLAVEPSPVPFTTSTGFLAESPEPVWAPSPPLRPCSTAPPPPTPPHPLPEPTRVQLPADITDITDTTDTTEVGGDLKEQGEREGVAGASRFSTPPGGWEPPAPPPVATTIRSLERLERTPQPPSPHQLAPSRRRPPLKPDPPALSTAARQRTAKATHTRRGTRTEKTKIKRERYSSPTLLIFDEGGDEVAAPPSPQQSPAAESPERATGGGEAGEANSKPMPDSPVGHGKPTLQFELPSAVPPKAPLTRLRKKSRAVMAMRSMSKNFMAHQASSLVDTGGVTTVLAAPFEVYELLQAQRPAFLAVAPHGSVIDISQAISTTLIAITTPSWPATARVVRCIEELFPEMTLTVVSGGPATNLPASPTSPAAITKEHVRSKVLAAGYELLAEGDDIDEPCRKEEEEEATVPTPPKEERKGEPLRHRLSAFSKHLMLKKAEHRFLQRKAFEVAEQTQRDEISEEAMRTLRRQKEIWDRKGKTLSAFQAKWMAFISEDVPGLVVVPGVEWGRLITLSVSKRGCWTKPFGVSKWRARVVQEVAPESAAHEAGIAPGFEVLAVNGKVCTKVMEKDMTSAIETVWADEGYLRLTIVPPKGGYWVCRMCESMNTTPGSLCRLCMESGNRDYLAHPVMTHIGRGDAACVGVALAGCVVHYAGQAVLAARPKVMRSLGKASGLFHLTLRVGRITGQANSEQSHMLAAYRNEKFHSKPSLHPRTATSSTSPAVTLEIPEQGSESQSCASRADDEGSTDDGSDGEIVEVERIREQVSDIMPSPPSTPEEDTPPATVCDVVIPSHVRQAAEVSNELRRVEEELRELESPEPARVTGKGKARGLWAERLKREQEMIVSGGHTLVALASCVAILKGIVRVHALWALHSSVLSLSAIAEAHVIRFNFVAVSAVSPATSPSSPPTIDPLDTPVILSLEDPICDPSTPGKVFVEEEVVGGEEVASYGGDTYEVPEEEDEEEEEVVEEDEVLLPPVHYTVSEGAVETLEAVSLIPEVVEEEGIEAEEEEEAGVEEVIEEVDTTPPGEQSLSLMTPTVSSSPSPCELDNGSPDAYWRSHPDRIVEVRHLCLPSGRPPEDVASDILSAWGNVQFVRVFPQHSEHERRLWKEAVLMSECDPDKVPSSPPPVLVVGYALGEEAATAVSQLHGLPVQRNVPLVHAQRPSLRPAGPMAAMKPSACMRKPVRKARLRVSEEGEWEAKLLEIIRSHEEALVSLPSTTPQHVLLEAYQRVLRAKRLHAFMRRYQEYKDGQIPTKPPKPCEGPRGPIRVQLSGSSRHFMPSARKFVYNSSLVMKRKPGDPPPCAVSCLPMQRSQPAPHPAPSSATLEPMALMLSLAWNGRARKHGPSPRPIGMAEWALFTEQFPGVGPYNKVAVAPEMKYSVLRTAASPLPCSLGTSP